MGPRLESQTTRQTNYPLLTGGHAARIPFAIERTAEVDEDGERGSELRGFDELQAARGDVRFLREWLLRQARLLAQTPEVPGQDFAFSSSRCCETRCTGDIRRCDSPGEAADQFLGCDWLRTVTGIDQRIEMPVFGDDPVRIRCDPDRLIASVAKPTHPATLREMIAVESDEREIRVIIPRGDLEVAQIEAILCPFRFASLVAESRMSKAGAMQIAEDSKADWWEKNHARFVSPEA